MKKIISFSLWGNDPKYCVGALRNAELASRIYPGWTCRFYMSSQEVGLETAGMTKCLNETYDILFRGGHEVVVLNEAPDWTGMFWRFYPACEDDVDVFISRDCDSRLGEREAEAVQRWLDGPQLIHAMRDHPEHSVPILGGMWGAKKGALPDLKNDIEKYIKGNFWQVDQNFLTEVVWPRNSHKMLVHDDWHRFPVARTVRFPTRRIGSEFVGSIINPNGTPAHPEHHSVFTK